MNIPFYFPEPYCIVNIDYGCGYRISIKCHILDWDKALCVFGDKRCWCFPCFFCENNKSVMTFIIA